MREALFVKQNKDKWLKFENALSHKMQTDPVTLGELYLEVTDNLSFAQTFYPNSDTTRYLNQLAVSAHQKLYKNKKTDRWRLLRYWTEDFPLEIYKQRRYLLISLVVFLFFSFVGVYSAAEKSDFVRGILGDSYVNMTLQNIENGDPMAVYKQSQEIDMFLGITINNIRVAFIAYVFGILLGIGSLLVIMQNAIMLGSFQYFFYEKGLLWESARTIWIHGTIEISVIIIAGAAGLLTGSSLFFPGTYSRLDAFMKGVKSGLKIVVSTIPLFVVAGFLEGFVTRHTEMPDALAVFIIGASLFVIIYYYAIYPVKVYRKFKTNPTHD
ncbi:MAG: stage II sporulation protein M [Flavobacteriaceae bacterium]|nr:stage II sporulation protein M [Flavobacteriaceae bacterium]